MSHDSDASIDWALLERYLLGGCAPAEAREVERALAASPDAGAAAIAAALRTVDLEANAASVDLSQLKQTIDHRIAIAEASAGGVGSGLAHGSEPAERQRRGGVVSRLNRPMWTGLARVALVACAVLLAAIGVGQRWMHRPSRTLSPASPGRYATTAGQFAVVTLADSSRVTLAPNSVLTVPQAFGGDERVVTLAGEAHFDVIPDRRHPLSVRTGGVTTRVLGTTFDIRYYASDIEGRVAVSSGKVATGAPNASMTLTAGMVGRFSDSAVIGTTADDSTTYTDWARGQLVFHDTPVPVMLAALRRWYGYEFRLADSTLAVQHVSAVFSAGETREMLDVVTHMLGVTITRQDSVLILQPETRPASRPRSTQGRQTTIYSTPTEVGR